MLSNLEIASFGICSVAIALLYSVYNTVFKEKKAQDPTLETMINGFNFVLPPEVAEYNKVKKNFSYDKQAVCSALFKRAVADFPLIIQIQSQSAGMQRLKRNDILRDAPLKSFQYAEEVLEKEIEEVRKEADRLRPEQNWGQFIFQQASQLHLHMEEKEKAVAAEKQKKREEKQKLINMEKEKKKKLERDEIQRKKIIENLIKEEENSLSMKKKK